MPQVTVDQALQIALQHHQAGRIAEAQDIYEQILAQQSNHPEALHYLGVARYQCGQLDAAIDLMHRAITVKPNYPEAFSNLGIALKDTAQLDAAIAAYRQALTLDPHCATAFNNLLLLLPYHPAYDAARIAAELSEWSRRFAEPLAKFIVPHTQKREPERRLRIGYVSPDFRDHPIAANLLRPLAAHDHARYEIFCYSGVRTGDAVTQRFQALADVWRVTTELSDEALDQQIRQDRIDILIDLSLHLAYNRLLVFARKPAPVQVTFAGYPGSTGLRTIDYRLTDPHIDPPGQTDDVYVEKAIRLPDCFWCYDPMGAQATVTPLPARTNGGVTFGCLNNFCKVDDHALALWARVLQAVPGSRMLILSPLGAHRGRLLATMERMGVNPARLELIAHQPRDKYLELYHRIDLGLDTVSCNGHTTSLDSFWMGVPVVTLVGQTAATRAGLCQLINLGLTELAARTPEDYVRIATNLAGDLPRLSDLRAALRQRMEQSPLMDGPRFARNLETAYRQIWHTWCEK